MHDFDCFFCFLTILDRSDTPCRAVHPDLEHILPSSHHSLRFSVAEQCSKAHPCAWESACLAASSMVLAHSGRGVVVLAHDCAEEGAVATWVGDADHSFNPGFLVSRGANCCRV